jgi:hypothetical protein
MSIGARAIPKKKEDKVMKTSLLVVLVAYLVCIFATIYVGAQTMVQGNQGEKVSQKVVPMKEVKITCPLSMVRAEITTPLLAGQWQTPQEGKLVHTKIQNIGGKKTLCREYWWYGTTVWIMHEMPTGVSGYRVLS